MDVAKKKSCLTGVQIEEKLRQAGIQPTAQRIAICQYVLCEADHATAEQIKHWADRNFPKLSLATVYNTLKVLVEGGLLKELRFPHSDRVVYDDNMSEHYHFLDEATGEVMDVEPEKVSIVSKLGKKFQVRSVEVLLRGRRG